MGQGNGGFLDRVLSEYERLCEKLTGVPMSEYKREASVAKQGPLKGPLAKASGSTPQPGGGILEILRQVINKWK